MRKKDVIYLVSALLFTFVFYKQSAGLNFFLFSLAIVSGLAMVRREFLTNRFWLLCGLAAIVSGFAVWLYASTLSLWANILSLLLLSAVTHSPKATPAFALVYAAFSAVSAPIRMFGDAILKKQQKEGKNGNAWSGKIGSILIITIVVVVFFVLYQQSNTLFKQFTEQIDFSWLDFNWVMFTLLGALILYGYYYPVRFAAWHNFDLQQPSSLLRDNVFSRPYTFMGRTFSEDSEFKAGSILLILLNILLLLVNSIDIIHLAIIRDIPEGMTYSDFVHQGTGNLILSILIAICILMFLFRSRQHFYSKPLLRQLAIAWVLQNLVLLLSSAWKNHLYIAEYALTYKRCGVYIYLFLAGIGLILTILKIKRNQSNWQLIRLNSFAFMIVLVLSSLVNWDGLITRYNLERGGKVDYTYLLRLGYTPLPYLLAQEDLKATPADIEGTADPDKTKIIRELHEEVMDFLNETDDRTWKSNCISRTQTRRRLIAEMNKGQTSCLFLPDGSSYTRYLQEFGSLKGLRMISYNNEPGVFPANLHGLTHLNCRDGYISSVSHFLALKQLSYLNLSNNSIADAASLSQLPALKVLDISGNPVIAEGLAGLTTLESLDASGLDFKSFKPLTNMKRLKSLHLTSLKTADWSSMPLLPALERIDISNNDLPQGKILLKTLRDNFPLLNSFTASSCRLPSLMFLTDYLDHMDSFGKYDPAMVSELFKGLSELNLSGNMLTSADALDYFPNLLKVDLSNNLIVNLGKGPEHLKLRELNISDNKLASIQGIQRFVALKKLDISNNASFSLTPLSALTQLEELNLTATPVSGLEMLAKSAKLRVLHLSADNPALLAGLRYLHQITDLHIYLTGKHRPEGIKELKSLKVVYLSNANEEDAEEFRRMLPRHVRVVLAKEKEWMPEGIEEIIE